MAEVKQPLSPSGRDRDNSSPGPENAPFTVVVESYPQTITVSEDDPWGDSGTATTNFFSAEGFKGNTNFKGKITAFRNVIRILKNRKLQGRWTPEDQAKAQLLAQQYADLIKDQYGTGLSTAGSVAWGLLSGALFFGSVVAGVYFSGGAAAVGPEMIGVAASGAVIGTSYGIIASESSDALGNIQNKASSVTRNNFDHLDEQERPSTWSKVKSFLALWAPAIVAAVGFASLFFSPISFLTSFWEGFPYVMAGTFALGTTTVQAYSEYKMDAANAINQDFADLGKLCSNKPKEPLEKILGITQAGLTEAEKEILVRHIADDGRIILKTKDQKLAHDSDPDPDELLRIISKIIGPSDQFSQEAIIHKLMPCYEKGFIDVNALSDADLRSMNADQEAHLRMLGRNDLWSIYRDSKVISKHVSSTTAEKTTGLIMAFVGAGLAAAALDAILNFPVSFVTFNPLALVVIGAFLVVSLFTYFGARKEIEVNARNANKQIQESISGKDGKKEEPSCVPCCEPASGWGYAGNALFSYKTIGTFISALALIANPFTGVPTLFVALLAGLIMGASLFGQSFIASRQDARREWAAELVSVQGRVAAGAEVSKKVEHQHDRNVDMSSMVSDEDTTVHSASMTATNSGTYHSANRDESERAPLVLTGPGHSHDD